MTIYRSYILFYCKATCNRFLLEGPKKLLTKNVTTNISSLEKREEHVTSHVSQSLFLFHGVDTPPQCDHCDWAHCSMWHHILSHRLREALSEQQQALRDRTQSGTVGSALIILQTEIMAL